MKTSNKILLATFLTVLLIMVSVHVALFAKYKKGDFTAVNDDMWPMNMLSQSLTGINYVSVDNVENLTIEAGDSSKFQYDKPNEGDENILFVTRKADTLFVVGKSTKNNIGRWYRRANLSISGLLPVHVKNSQLRINRSKSNQSLAMDISLDEAFMEVNNDSQETLSFSTIKLNAVRGSRINFFNANINSLDVSLHNSFLEETTLNADSIKINTDAASKIQLSGKNLQKAKITSHE
jgi:hypothetical protein